MWNDAMWIGIPHSELEKWKILEGDLNGRFAYYRCDIQLKEKGCLLMDITANSRYRLWINGRPVLSGPCKGDLHRHYYETVDVSEYLKEGHNVLAVQVLYNNAYSVVKQTDERAAIFGVLTQGGGHRLAVEGDIRNEIGELLATVTTGNADWKVYLDGSYYLKSYAITENLGAVCEELDFQKFPEKWKSMEYSAEDWSIPPALESVKIDAFCDQVGIVRRFQVKERPIPLLFEEEADFSGEISTAKIPESGIFDAGFVKVKAGETRELLLDAGVESNGYPAFRFEKGKGSKVSITYFEKFVSDTVKINKTDAENGKIEGITDQIILNGEEIIFEPFWYRTFRFVYMKIEAKEDDVSVYLPKYRRTGYPLNPETCVKSSAKWVEEVWEICVRTLQNCMMETYMDCPYYEQMQFPMDTRLQALFNYVVSRDIKLAKKALEDYHCSMIPEGLIHGKYPSAYTQIISTFSMHYIYMMEEYYQHTGDINLVKKYLPDADRILNYYDSKIGSDGMVGRLGYWEFVDWQEAWKHTGGTPAALQNGPSVIINLMYCLALRCAANLCRAMGRSGLAEEYLARRAAILKVIQEKCWDEQAGLYREGPDFIQYSQHAQAWAVLNDMADTETQKHILRNAMNREDIIKCSFSTAYEWFRAMEKAGIYEETEGNMMRWAQLRAMGNTTCPEEPDVSRSECHAWSALPLYEMVRSIDGINAEEAGWKTVRIQPHLSYVPDLEGTAITPVGDISFRYKRENGKWKYSLKMPHGVKGIFIDENGMKYELNGDGHYEL